jgi:hypothetical protein
MVTWCGKAVDEHSAGLVSALAKNVSNQGKETGLSDEAETTVETKEPAQEFLLSGL